MGLSRSGGTADFGEVFNQGLKLYQSSRFDEAIDRFNLAIEIRSNVPEPYYQRAMAFARLGELSRAIRDFEQVFGMQAADRLKRDACYNLGKAYDGLQQPEESIRWYDRATQIDPDFANVYCNRGGVRLKLGDKNSDLHEFERALADLNKGLSLNPSDALAYFNRAIANRALENHDQISGDLQKFLELAPPDHPYRREVEKLLSESAAPASPKLGMLRKREQQDLIQKIIEANSEKRFGDALQYCDKFLEKNRLEPTVWDEKSFALTGLERYQEALACCEEGLSVNPSAARLYLARGSLLAWFKRYREAIGAFERYLAIAPPEYAENFPQVKADIQALRRLLNE
jgi:tetratricopeptide (TPR) repeat protein